MEKQETFNRSVLRIALPVTLQSLLQSSFSVVDQIMVGRLGSESIAGVGLGGKFSSLYSVLLGAVAAAAAIMISQYMGQNDEKEVRRSFSANFFLALLLAVIFFTLCVCIPGPIMALYTKDAGTRDAAAGYLRILAFSYVPMAISLLSATMLRCMERAVWPLYASLLAAVLNTGLNYVLIFGKGGLPRLGVNGAAAASVISQLAACVLTVAALYMHVKRAKATDPAQDFLWDVRKGQMAGSGRRKVLAQWFGQKKGRQYLDILLPIIVCEFLWSLGENIYAAIYGNMGTASCAAMTLTIPMQTLLIGALGGISQAAGILIGKSLGAQAYEKAYRESKKLMLYGFLGSVLLLVLLMAGRGIYVQIYKVEPEVHTLAGQLLLAFALIAPVKVQNMILGGGIIRSGGKTNYIMWVDMIGTWCFGVPLGLLAAFVWNLSVPYVYFILSLEECVRLAISLAIFKGRKWMRRI